MDMKSAYWSTGKKDTSRQINVSKGIIIQSLRKA